MTEDHRMTNRELAPHIAKELLEPIGYGDPCEMEDRANDGQLVAREYLRLRAKLDGFVRKGIIDKEEAE